MRYGINQRVAQEVLGHSDANLTAKVYTDVPALALHTEIAKLPWIEAQPVAETPTVVENLPERVAAAPVEPAPSDAHTGSQKPVALCADAQLRAQESGKSCHTPALADLCAKFVEDVNITDAEGFSHVLTSLVTSLRSGEMAARAGIEPALGFLQACVAAAVSEIAKSADAHIGTQKLGELWEVVAAWPKLSPELRAAVLAVIQSAAKRQ